LKWRHEKKLLKSGGGKLISVQYYNRIERKRGEIINSLPAAATKKKIVFI
jgi:hypothetical protein